ncbi:VOC family protein [Brachybacterium sp. AOP25-B2-12]|uniref:VOC family protein n=1 Tax=Brachybacterium sp. AOP25-B2-12 TaxID=3457710 RepID=UPI004033342A
MTDAAGGRVLAIQAKAELRRSTWPSEEVPMQLHLDMALPDADALRAATARAVELGAQVLHDRTDDPQEPLYVLADPEGHPFCLLVG